MHLSKIQKDVESFGSGGGGDEMRVHDSSFLRKPAECF